MAEIRLDKFLADRTAYSRSEVKTLLRKGAVKADGIVITDGKQKINPDTQNILLYGKKIHGGMHIHLLLNKPEGYICATEDRQHHTVMELIPESLRHKDLFPAGRLDIDSTGLVLVTSDGGLAHQLLSPKHHVPKYYLVTLARDVEEGYIQALADGLILGDGTVCLPAQIQKTAQKQCLICLHEGKYHQVKRMFAALGNHVIHLHRVAVGGLLLPPDLHSGGYLEILHKDIEKMLNPDSFPAMCEQIVYAFSSYLINKKQ